MKKQIAAPALTEYELDLLDRLTLHAIANGNTVFPKPYEPTPEEYKALHTIRIKLELNGREKKGA